MFLLKQCGLWLCFFAGGVIFEGSVTFGGKLVRVGFYMPYKAIFYGEV